jgi:hypothetical protein
MIRALTELRKRCYVESMHLLRASILGLSFLSTLVACSEEPATGDPPAAPTNLEVVQAGGGAHLTWEDNSDNEDEFLIMRKDGTAEYQELASVTFDSVQYHDEPLISGTMYVYKIVAVNADGESESNEVTFDAP